MCEAVRELDSAQARYKTYIDQLLAVVLETNSALLEGMPRLQQSTGLRLDLLRVASRGEVGDDWDTNKVFYYRKCLKNCKNSLNTIVDLTPRFNCILL